VEAERREKRGKENYVVLVYEVQKMGMILRRECCSSSASDSNKRHAEWRPTICVTVHTAPIESLDNSVLPIGDSAELEVVAKAIFDAKLGRREYLRDSRCRQRKLQLSNDTFQSGRKDSQVKYRDQRG
jgi:hypothetical protein